MSLPTFPKPRCILLGLILLAAVFAGCDSLTSNEDDEPAVDAAAELDKLAGAWVLVDGNNPNTIGSEIEIGGNTGILTEVAGGSLSVGDVKWDAITPTGTGEYDHKELGSDGNYYDASMRLEDENTLFVTVDAAGAGNRQTWARKGTSGANEAELAQIAGDWVRIAGDNPSNNGMEITVDGNTGVVTQAAGSFNAGDVKWDQITPAGSGSFDHQELGSDGNYYDAEMTLVSGDTLMVVVVAFGSNPEQTWVRKEIVTAELAKIEGDWVRIAGDNPSNNGMEITVDGNTGVVTQAAGSFNAGDVKWDQITPAGSGTFDHQELGSDGNYYNAEMTLLDENTIELVVLAFSFPEQTWARKGTEDRGGSGGGDALTLACSGFDTARTLNRRNESIDYIVPSGCVLDVTGELVIEPGVTIAFEENAGMGVYSGGSVQAEGSETEPITFQGTSDLKGWWRGIHIETNSLQNRLDHIVIANAGANYVYCCNQPASLFQKDGRLAITNSTIRDGAGYGLVARNAGSFEQYSNLTITGHDDAPLRIGALRLGELDGTGSDYAGNSRDVIEVNNNTVSEAVRVFEQNVPYEITDVLDVTAPLEMDPGVEILFGQDAGIGIYDAGTLNVQGTGSDPVIFRGTSSVRGWWRGIHIETNSPNNLLLNVDIRHAGSNYVYCCNEVASVFLKDGRASIVNTTIADGASFGIYASSDFSFIDYQGNTITSHAEAPLYMAIERVDELDGVGTDYSGNDDDHLRIFRSSVDDAITWSETNVPYLVDMGRVLDLRAPVEIQAGTEIVMGENSGLGVYDGGTFTVSGTFGNPVVLRGVENVQGYWRGIHTETNSLANLIEYATIRNAGSNYVYCCNDAAALFVKSGRMQLENSAILNSGGCGVTYRSAATFEETGNTYTNNADGNVCSP